MDMQPDIVMKKDGKMMMRRHGELKPMDMVMTMPNGARVMMDGTIIMADGTSRMMMDGEAMTLDASQSHDQPEGGIGACARGHTASEREQRWYRGQ